MIKKLVNSNFIYYFTLCIILALTIYLLIIYTAKSFTNNTTVNYSKFNHSINEPLVINFQANIKNIDLKDIIIEPYVEGKWKFQKGSLVEKDKLFFIPKYNFSLNTIYKVKNITVYNWFRKEVSVNDIAFTTEPIEGIKLDGLFKLEENQTVAYDYKFYIATKYQRNIELETIPEIQFNKINDNVNNVITWEAKNGILPQGSNIQIELFENEKSIYKKQLRIAPEPTINLSKNFDITTEDTLLIQFNEPMETQSDNFIEIDTPIVGKWLNDKEYSFNLPEIKPAQTYNYIIKSGLKTKNGGILTNDITGNIVSLGEVKVSELSPQGYGLKQDRQTIVIKFNQPVDRLSVEQRFSVSAGEIKRKYWIDNSFYVDIENIGYQKNVKYTLQKGVMNTAFGLPSKDYFSSSFTTEARITKYNVPLFKQQKSATCTAAALRMVLAYRGINTSEDEIVTRMGYNPRQIDLSTSPPTWDDPSQMFVGYVDGKDDNTAAGPDADPLALVAKSYGRNSYVANGVDANWIASKLSQGSLVIAFGTTKGRADYRTWQTPTGQIRKMNKSSHVRAVIGYQGEPYEPLGFWLNDPLLGSTQYWSSSKLQNDIWLDAYQQVVVVE